MKSLCILVFVGVVTSASAYYMNLMKDEWESFKLQHGKNYTNGIEDIHRMITFTKNKHKIAKHNQLFHSGHRSFKLGLNKYADMEHEEFVTEMIGSRSIKRVAGHKVYRDCEDDYLFLPETVDWRKEGAVTPVKDQEGCGSCWAFSATGALEGQHYRRTGKLVSLSEQNLIDCSRGHPYDNLGCQGGLVESAFQYIKDNGGINTEESYPYEKMNNVCRYNASESGVESRGFVNICAGCENALKKAIALVGPVSVAFNAGLESFHLYQQGIYSDSNCSEHLDHAVLVVGYGTTDEGEDYWLVKNSWGESWGESGYFKIARNKNMCGIANDASFPQV